LEDSAVTPIPDALLAQTLDGGATQVYLTSIEPDDEVRLADLVADGEGAVVEASIGDVRPSS
jgi:hypothetical protein